MAACKLAGASGAPTRASFSGEGPAVRSFSTGDLDLAYTGAGYDKAVGLGPTDPTQQRPTGRIPIALNAAVLGVGGGSVQPTVTRAVPDDPDARRRRGRDVRRAARRG